MSRESKPNTGRILISTELMEAFLQFPEGWKVTGATFNGEQDWLALSIEGDGVENGDYIGTFNSKSITDEDGTWIKGEWKTEKRREINEAANGA